jgi:hypothetical protein
LVKVERLSGNKFERTSYGDSLQLAWSSLSDRSLSAIDLPEGIPHFMDIISTRETSDAIHTHTAGLPFRYKDLFWETTTYRITIIVSGEWVAPAAIQLLFTWTGRWNHFPVSSVSKRNQLKPG